MKICTNCKEDLPLEKFGINRALRSGLQNQCKNCLSEKRKVMYWKNPEKYRAGNKRRARKKKPSYHENRRLVKAYGITLKEKRALVDQQNNRCPICGTEDPVALDHNHQTGKIRGVLCQKCNRGLGHFQDDPILLIRAVIYLVQDG